MSHLTPRQSCKEWLQQIPLREALADGEKINNIIANDEVAMEDVEEKEATKQDKKLKVNFMRVIWITVETRIQYGNWEGQDLRGKSQKVKDDERVKKQDRKEDAVNSGKSMREDLIQPVQKQLRNTSAENQRT